MNASFSRYSHYLSVALFQAKLSLQRQLEYPIFLLNWALMLPIQYFSGVWMLQVLCTRFEGLSGWTFHQIAFIYGLALLSHGLQIMFFIPTWQIEWLANSGQFDRMIVRPMDVLFQVLTRLVNLIGVFDLIPGTVIFVYACVHLNLAWTLPNVLGLVVVVFGAMLLRAGLYLIVNSTAFWTLKSGALNGVMLDIQQRGSLYPLSFYPWFLQWVFSMVIPIGFISFYPAADWLQVETPRPLPQGVSWGTPVIGVLVFWIGVKVFRLGLKRYESAGS